MLTRYAAVAAGGVVGATLRWAIDDWLNGTTFHWAILLVNVLGCLFLGFLLVQEARSERHRMWLHDFGAIGFCGGLTTMSTFSLDVVKLTDAHQYSTALAYLVANIVAGFAALVAGAAIGRRVDALRYGVEQSP